MFGCSSCNPIKYYYYGMCSETWPTPEYLPQNTNYQWVKQDVTKYINVEILKDPYLYKLPRNNQIYLKAYINNSRGLIDTAKWSQISPAYSKVTDNLFTMEINEITNEVYNTQLTLRMKMTAFTYISQVTSVKIMIEVNNTMGDVAKQLTEFYANPAPTIGTMTQEILSGQTKPEDGSTTLRYFSELNIIYRIRLSGWYDNVDDTTQRLKFKFYYLYDGRIFVLKNAGSSETFDVSLPHVAIATNSTTRVTIQIWVDAIDDYLAVDTLCISLKEVLLTYTEDKMDDVTTALEATSFTSDEVTLATAAVLEVISPTYYRSPVQPHIATVDFQWYNGVVDTKSGSNYCKWNQGYQGQVWQYTIKSYYNIKQIVSNMMAQAWSKYGSATTLELFDFDVLVSSLRGIVKDPEMLAYSEMEHLVQLFEKASYMDNYTLIALDSSDYSGDAVSDKIVHNPIKMYFELAERMFGKIYMEKTKIKTDPTHIRFPGLKMNEVLEAEENQMKELNNFSFRIHNATIRFIKEIMFRLGTKNSEYSYIGDLAFEFKVAIGYPPNFEGNQFYIKNSDIYWEIPSGLFNDHQNVASSKQQVYLLAIKWLANPHILNGDLPTHIGTNMTSLVAYDGIGNELSISNLNNPISVVFPYEISSGYTSEFLKWQYYSTSQSRFLKDGWGFAYIKDVQLPWSTWAAENVTFVTTDAYLCRWNHLTTIGGVYEQNSISKRNLPKVGLYLNYYALNYWTKSFGYYLLWPVIFIYITSVTVAIILDWLTLKDMRRKIEDRIMEVRILNDYDQDKTANSILFEKEISLNDDDNHSSGINGSTQKLR